MELIKFQIYFIIVFIFLIRNYGQYQDLEFNAVGMGINRYISHTRYLSGGIWILFTTIHPVIISLFFHCNEPVIVSNR